MIEADFEVYGKNADELMVRAEEIAATLMGDRPYGLSLSIKTRTLIEQQQIPLSWKADVHVRVQHAWTPSQPGASRH